LRDTSHALFQNRVQIYVYIAAKKCLHHCGLQISVFPS